MPKDSTLTLSKKKKIMALMRAQRMVEAKKELEEICQQQPANPEIWHLLGMVSDMLGHYERSVEHNLRAISLRPNFPEAYFCLGNSMISLGRLPEASNSFRTALILDTHYAEAKLCLAQVLLYQDKATEAEFHSRDFLRQMPHNATGHFQLGNSLIAQYRHAEAEIEFRESLRLKPDYIEAYNNLGTVLRVQNRLAEAETAYRQALALKPDFAGALANLGVVLHLQGQTDSALEYLEKSLNLNPNQPETRSNLGSFYALAGKYRKAQMNFRAALRLDPNSVVTLNNLFNTHIHLFEIDEAISCHREICRLDSEMGRANYSTFLLILNYHHAWTRQEIFEEHRRWGERHAPQLERQTAHANNRDPERRLRIGYVSPDFRLHAVAFFMEPILANHTRSRFEIYCYAHVIKPDAVTTRIKSLATHWRSLVDLDDAQAAELIRSDKIDILIDLGGHTAHSRLTVFAHQPAPVQAAYIGYPNTTGLPAMDYRILDPVIVPPGNEAYYTEKPLYLTHHHCFSPPEHCPPVNTLPALTSGHIMFGSFNNPIKFGPPVIALWADVLQSVPDSRLMLKSKDFAHADIRDLFHNQFSAHGIAHERVILRGADPLMEYLRAYNDIDIGLDPFPFNGSTTTYHALWMGVPVVALVGERQVSRMGYAIHATLGLEDLVAETPDKYVRIAANLAKDHIRLSALRVKLRERMRESTLTDGKLVTSELESLYRELWRKWCLEKK